MASNSQSGNGGEVPPVLPSIPLSPEPGPRDQSVGVLVSDVMHRVSDLLRAEVELAKAEVTAEVRKGVQGSVFFIIAAVIGLFSLFYLFFTVAEFLSWLLDGNRWAGFGITFLVMLLVAGVFGLLGYLRVRKIRKPERTIDSVRDATQALKERVGGEQRQLTDGRGESSTAGARAAR